VTTSNPFSLEGKVAIVTGGGRGIGAGIAKALARAGASVALVSRTQEQIDATAAEITSAGGAVLGLPTDVTEFIQLDAALNRTIEHFGGLDIVVNCAGGGDMWKAFLDEDSADMEAAFHFNVSVPFELVQRATPHLLERPGSSVINIISGAIWNPTRGHLSYDASKGALHFATRSMAASLGP
jgi:7-alpha-hydroxysteroid dehydrogenase